MGEISMWADRMAGKDSRTKSWDKERELWGRRRVRKGRGQEKETHAGGKLAEAGARLTAGLVLVATLMILYPSAQTHTKLT